MLETSTPLALYAVCKPLLWYSLEMMSALAPHPESTFWTEQAVTDSWCHTFSHTLCVIVLGSAGSWAQQFSITGHVSVVTLIASYQCNGLEKQNHLYLAVSHESQQ